MNNYSNAMMRTLFMATMAESLYNRDNNSYNGIKNGLYIPTTGKVNLEHKLSKRQRRKRKAINKSK